MGGGGHRVHDPPFDFFQKLNIIYINFINKNYISFLITTLPISNIYVKFKTKSVTADLAQQGYPLRNS